MPTYEYVTVDVFTDRRFGGNPLAVFPDARGLSDAQMQDLAREFNYSETTFVLPPADPRHTAEVRIFTPTTELPFAGHPNVGTGYVLASRAQAVPDHFTFEEKAGLVRVHILRDEAGRPNGARISSPQSLSVGIAVPTDLVAAAASLEDADIATTTHEPLVASVGTKFVIAEVASVDALRRAVPDIGRFRHAVVELDELQGRFALYLYARVEGDATRLRARMFAPLGGVIEDPATGSANATVAALLTSLAPGSDVDLAYDISQGEEIGRPSRLLATARKTAEGPVLSTVAGNCVPVMRGQVEI
ncbi:Phenazine biosynthesis protein PhzF like [Rhodovastum atsumiense]|uniref:PhzF family phenazine biosynthesis protein n=1 Tax=Rhodovastum atsumiense TaxID=504468 RepID=A0A5M6IJQ9_9PROT|nr:PhzF family phenazine biosynthesis protein [Rhodovastum atsumiense]KAA5608412.1 PhzF family phenazine biosynthesis protein [Rhodovastum atsumiense]CAH2599398.1 Phenazine biosynthesis protein PhzF like [Rhodovastum atsumiense]